MRQGALMQMAARLHTSVERRVREQIRLAAQAGASADQIASIEREARARLTTEASERLAWAAAEHGADTAHHRGPTT